jgi:hypothetical protein
MKRTLSHRKFLDQFYIKELYCMTLSCLKNKTKFKSHRSQLNFSSLPKTIGASLIDLTWEMMVGTIMNANFLNLVVVKFVKFLNNIGLACIVMKTSQTLEIKSIDYPPTFPSVVKNFQK